MILTNSGLRYIVTELMDTDLEVILKSKQALSEQHIQYFVYQMLCAVRYIHSANVLHRDIKPSNILCNEDCTIKLADFGLARVRQQCDDLTEYVTTRWYRAPEIILAWRGYSQKIDIWSVGCILAEMYVGSPVFQGKHYINQIERITDILGSALPEDIEMLTSENARQFLRNMGHKPKIPWAQLIPNASPVLCDLLDRLLEFNPNRRCNVDEALNHPYFESVRDEESEELAEEIFSFDFEQWQNTKESFQELFYQEICHFHPDALVHHPPSSLMMDLASPHIGSMDWYSPSNSYGDEPLTPTTAFLNSVASDPQIIDANQPDYYLFDRMAD